ncbi:HDOD domain-containing protein [Ectothiorhodospira lacustris]|uniref:HDOD domain-containing protein n=1 Tax=Ectothiorhodospira lacustris TaxID=2899127 RepID=UPI001EE8645C|nr:HDOD domain-containing protein [Ectothiorhodospira lacustris]MCG5500873.1 HDOD domain-containing protein [Ectothiorhodospira lacustris]MCG5511393.1 HDOD domain-containing protein [Ectothiorhodospira lacustris]MCG5523206.1 HDOD domain-containing protein [Ectothiorhodospira lacustris]
MAASTDAPRFEDLVPINELSEAGRNQLRIHLRKGVLRAGNKLSPGHDATDLVYLLSGRLSLVSRGVPEEVRGGMERACQPLFSDRHQGEFAVAETDCILLRVSRQIFAALLSRERTAGVEVVDVDVDETQGSIFRDLYQATINGRLELPPMPEVAMRIQRMAQDPDIGVTEITQVIQTDPVVAGAIMHATNSPLFRAGKPINNIRDAVIRLGFNATQKLAFNIAMRQAFQARSPRTRQHMHELWDRSVDISAIAYVLGRHLKGFDPDRAQLAGLMHEIGTIPILNYLDRHKIHLNDEQLEHTITKLRGMTGVMVLNYWGMDPELVSVAEHAGNWQREHPNPGDYCDLVIVSRLLSKQGAGQGETLPPLDQVPAFRKLDLGPIDEDMSLGLLKETEQEIAALRNILHG